MSKLTIKAGCVEAVFKRGRGWTTTLEHNQPLKTEQTSTPSKMPLREAEPEALVESQSQDDGTPTGSIKAN